VSITVSIGVTVFTPGDSLQQLMERADNAMYGAKRAGRNRVRAHAPE
jgi:diguanylate cyclase (GGDEF)-like protein